MMRVLLCVALALVLAVALAGLYLYRQVQGLESEAVSSDVYMISGFGGNVAVLKTADGPVVVDSMTFTTQGDNIRSLAEELGGGPIMALINTHYHSDHTHGNPGFAAGTRIVSTQRSLEHLLALEPEFWEGETQSFLPNETFDRTHELSIGGKTVRLYFLGRGHTDGDLVVLFVEDRVLHAGDLVFNQFYPNIDLEAGGSIPAWLETLNAVAELPFDTVIPGHGPVTDLEGIRAYQGFLTQLWTIGQKAASEEWSLEQTVASEELTTDADFGVIGIPFLFALDRDFVLQRAYEEATGAVLPYDAP